MWVGLTGTFSQITLRYRMLFLPRMYNKYIYTYIYIYDIPNVYLITSIATFRSFLEEFETDYRRWLSTIAQDL